MSETVAKFVWYEWMGADPARAASFYGAVVGWNVVESGMAGFPYRIASAGQHGVGGLFATPPEAQGTPACWSGYVAVEDVDAAADKLTAAGGNVLRPAWDIPNVGRSALVVDPQGAPFLLFHPLGGEPPPAPAEGTPGLVGWRELHASDGKTAQDFYASQFGWREDRQHDMGPMGVYRIFKAGDQEGGVMTKNAQGPGPCWLFYFNVEAADAANARVSANGGKIVNGPHEVPGGLFATQVVDPEGALFGLKAFALPNLSKTGGGPMRVMVIVKATTHSEAGERPSPELMAAMGAFNQKLIAAGVMLDGGGLKPSARGARVAFDGGARSVIPGPFAATSELVSGYWIWKVASLEEAIDWVKQCPNPMPVPSEIEIRPLYEMEDFA